MKNSTNKRLKNNCSNIQNNKLQKTVRIVEETKEIIRKFSKKSIIKLEKIQVNNNK